jgi:hypothetical protein
MNWNKRYAHESSHPWPENVEELIDHMSIHHHDQLKNAVTHFTNMVDQLGDAVPKGMRTTVINKLIKDHLTEGLKTGEVEPTRDLAVHEFMHGRTDGPDRGHDFVTVQSPEEVDRQRALIDHEHTTIPDSNLT